ncbi:MAG: PDZ domain-containing protein [Fuerstiella sp.]|nr:PDZ domain-containing protein [Fuerstiella sp.]
MKRMLLLTLCFCGITQADADADLVTLKARQSQLDKALDKVSPALVAVEDGYGAGSGVVVSADGVVLTASHVVNSRRRGSSSRLRVRFPDGSDYRAEIMGMNRSVDAAMLRIIDRPRNGESFPHVDLGDSSKLQRGDWCFALGHPGGFQPNRPAPVRLGRVLSAGHRTVVSDCAIVLGDSGGPLFDLSGRLIGIHSMITEVIVENRHVAVDAFRRDGDRMENRESWGKLQAHDNDLVETSFVGMVLRWRNFTPEVSRVLRGSPADRAGVRPGDLLLTIADQSFADPLGLSTLLTDIAEEQRVKVRIDRVGREKDLTMTTGRKPTDDELARREDNLSREDQEHLRDLKNQLTSFRRVGPFEKRSTEELDRFIPAVSQARGSVVEFRELGETLTLGTVMSDDGYILTKASELENVIAPECILSDGRRLEIQEVAIDRAFDLMLVKVDVHNLDPVQWATTAPPEAGRILITTDSRGTPLLPGVVSVPARTLQTSSKGFLGVHMQMLQGSRYVSLKDVLPGGAAERNGLKKDDIVLAINGTQIRNTYQMGSIVGSAAPNQKISLKYQRDNTVRTVDIVLTPRFVSPDREVMLDRYREDLGKFASSHNSGFPEALQHDTDLFPHQCGGPLFDISGKAVGLNIARAARITSYAIPAKAVLRVFEELKNKGEASRLKEAS